MTKQTTFPRKLRLAAAILLLAGILLPSPSAMAAPSYVPTPQQPSGSITDTTPTFQWSKQTGGTHYKFQVWMGSTMVYTLVINANAASGTCSGATCSNTPATVLSAGNYVWQVRAKVGGVWGAWSAFKSFTVQSGGFNSQFTNNANGWTSLTGGWSHDAGLGIWSTQGVDAGYATTRYAQTYSTLTYEVKLKLTNGGDPLQHHGIFVRAGQPTISSCTYIQEGITLEINESGRVGVWLRRNCLWYQILVTMHPAVHVADWNILKVTANGSFMQFFVNGTKIADGYIDFYGSGWVGVYMSDDEGFLDVDYAKLNLTAPAAVSAADSANVIHLDLSNLGEAVDR